MTNGIVTQKCSYVVISVAEKTKRISDTYRQNMFLPRVFECVQRQYIFWEAFQKAIPENEIKRSIV